MAALDPLSAILKQKKAAPPPAPVPASAPPAEAPFRAEGLDVNAALGREQLVPDSNLIVGEEAATAGQRVERALAPSSNVDFPMITDICERVSAEPSEGVEAVRLLLRALAPGANASPRRRLKALTILNELVYDPLIAEELRKAEGALPALREQQLARNTGLGEEADEHIRMLATELDRNVFGGGQTMQEPSDQDSSDLERQRKRDKAKTLGNLLLLQIQGEEVDKTQTKALARELSKDFWSSASKKWAQAQAATVVAAAQAQEKLQEAHVAATPYMSQAQEKLQEAGQVAHSKFQEAGQVITESLQDGGAGPGAHHTSGPFLGQAVISSADLPSLNSFIGRSGGKSRSRPEVPVGGDPLGVSAKPRRKEQPSSSSSASVGCAVVIHLADFAQWRSANPGEIAHLKGFSKGISDCYRREALAVLDTFSIVAWEGDPPDESSFTALVPAFLAEKPGRQAVAFIKSNSIEIFQAAWQQYATKFKGQMMVVAIDVEPDAARFNLRSELSSVSVPELAHEFYLLGRIAMKATGSKQAVALGGVGIAGQEAQASLADGVLWTVYALSRGSKEGHPSLLDWAAAAEGPNVTLVCGKDPNYGDAFAEEVPPANQAQAQWLG